MNTRILADWILSAITLYVVSAGCMIQARADFAPSSSTPEGLLIPEVGCVPEDWLGGGKVCFYPGSGALGNTLLYYFHGVSGGERDWEGKEIPLELKAEWKKKELGTPNVIAISYGMFWLATPSGNFGYTGKLNFLTPNLLTELEKRYPLTHIRQRWLYGDSMGGHTAWQLALRFPQFFNKVATSCPAGMSVTPFQYPYEFISYSRESGGSLPWILGATGLFRSFYKTSEDWEKESPFALLKEFKPNLDTQYLIVGVKDDAYGFTLSNREMVKRLKSQGADVHYFEDEAAKHCYPSVAPFVEFLVPEE